MKPYSDEQLEKLAALVRQHRPRQLPNPAFKQEFAQKLADGFHSDSKTRLSRLRQKLNRLLANRQLVFGSAASLLIVLAVAVALINKSPDQLGRDGGIGNLSQPGQKPESGIRQPNIPTKNKLTAPGIAAQDYPPDYGGGGRGSQDQATGSDFGFAQNTSRRKVERSTELTLGVSRSEIPDVANQVIAVSDRHRGIVIDSNIETGNDQSGQASFDLRIPQSQLSSALSDLSKLGNVLIRSESGHDITASYNSVHDQIQEARAQRSSLIMQLANAGTEDRANRIKQKLNQVNVRINSLKSSFAQLRNRANYSKVSVSLETKGGSTTSGTSSALKDSLNFLQDVANFTIRAAAVIVVSLLLVGFLAFTLRWARKRWLNSALD